MSQVAVLEVLLGLCFSNFGVILYLSLPFPPFKTGRKSLLSHFFVEMCLQGVKIYAPGLTFSFLLCFAVVLELR